MKIAIGSDHAGFRYEAIKQHLQMLGRDVRDFACFSEEAMDCPQFIRPTARAEGEFAETLKKLMALPRYGTADEIAGMVAYLASAEAGYITGASLLIDGGFAA